MKAKTRYVSVEIPISLGQLEKTNELRDQIDAALKKAKAGKSTGAGFDLTSSVRDISFDVKDLKKSLSIMEPFLKKSPFEQITVTGYDEAGKGTVVLTKPKVK
jgi:hypothetical protein